MRSAFNIISHGGDIHEASIASGIPTSYLYTMLRNEIRKDIYEEYDFKDSKIKHIKRWSNHEKRDIQNMYNSGYTAKEVAAYFNISATAVYNICKRRK